MTIGNGDNPMRTYELHDTPVRFEHMGEYIFLYMDDETFYQFKFEFEDFFVGDYFDADGELIEEFAMWVFGVEA